VPIEIGGDLGYLSVGLHIDSEDWQELAPRTIVDTVLAQRSRGNVVLLHDGGGRRVNTVAALGPLIDSLRARGDTLVLLSTLIGQPRDEVMQPLPSSSAFARFVELGTFGLIGAVEWGGSWLFLIAIVLGLGRMILVCALAAWQRYGPRRPAPVGYAPAVSVVVPAYNEEKVIVDTVTSLLRQDYAGPLEIVVVDDGSPDATYSVVRDAFGSHPTVTVLTKPNGGKASALNQGIARASGEIVIALDADTQFVPDTVRLLVAPLVDPHVGAVAGNAKVGNRINLVTRWQAVEYVTSQNLDRRAFALLDCITVVPGAVGAWRRELLLRVGGFTDDTLAEDQDVTLAISKLGYGIAYADAAVAYTEAPDTVRGLAKQRFRWSFGTLQCLWKHRDALFRPRYGTLGMVAMPNVWLFQLVFAALSPLADLLFLWSLLSVWLTWREHGATYAATNLEQVLTFYAIFLVVDWVAAVVAFLMEPDEDRRLTWLILLQRFAYRQIMYWVVVRSFAAALRGHVVGWGKLERKATVELPA
jgi:cellulose synthase/poly-beta-1,6-N-acetylglucosamine synthase-like glycosyltransferase